MTTNVNIVCSQCGTTTRHPCPSTWPPVPAQPTDRPGIDQLRNLADRAERGPLTPDEAARLRDGIDTLHIRLWNAEDSSKAWERKADEQQARAERTKAELTALKSITSGYCGHCGRGDCSPTANQWYEQRVRADKAEAELAAFHGGEEPHPDDRTVPTPAQWIWQWNRATPAKRLEVAARVIADSDMAGRCFEAAHEKDLDRTRRRAERAEAALTAVRELHQRWDADPASCAHCVDGYGTPVRYPCPTTVLLDHHGQTTKEN